MCCLFDLPARYFTIFDSYSNCIRSSILRFDFTYPIKCLMCTIEWLHVLMRNIKIKWKIISEMKHEKTVKMNNYDRYRHVKTSLWIISKWNSLFHINKYIRTVCHWNWAMKILLAASDMFVCFQFTVQFDCNRKCKRIKICKIPKITYCIIDYRLFSKMMSSARSNGSWMSIFFSKN